MANDLATDELEQLPPARVTPPPAPAPPPTPATKDPTAADYDRMFDEQDGGRKQQLRNSLVQSQDETPDRAADVIRLSQQTGIPQDVVGRNYDEIRKHTAIEQAPLTDIVRDTPALATWAADPKNAAVAHDDMEQLGTLEWLVSMPSRAISQSINEQLYGELRTKSIFQPLTQEEQDRLSSYKLHAQMGGELGSGQSWFRGALTKTMKLLTTLTAPEAIPTAAGAAGGAVIGGVGGAFVGGVGAIPGAIAGAKIGAEAGYTYGMGSSAFKTAAGAAYDDFLESTDALGRKLDPEVAKALAVTSGAINAGLMLGGGKLIASGIDAAGGKVASMLTRDAIKAAIRQPSVAGAIAEMVKGYGLTLTEGTALMVAMKTNDILMHAIATSSGERAPVAGMQEPGNIDLFKQPAVQNADGSVSTVDSFSVNIDGKEVLLPTVTPDGRHLSQDDALAEFQKTGRHMGKFDSPAAADAFAKQVHEDYAAGKYATPTIGQQLLAAAKEGVQSFALIGAAGPALGLVREFRNAQRAQQGVEFFKALGEGVEQSKTAKRLPEAAQAFLETATKDGPVQTLYTGVEDWTRYWQEHEVDPREMAAHVTGDPDAYDNALKTGEDLAIPTARYATKLAGTEHNAHFSDELRLGPEEMNGRESKALIEKMGQAPDEATKPEAGSPVYQNVLEQLTKGAGVSEETAAQYATLVDNAFGSMAERAGVDPLELFSQYGLTVGRPDLPEPAPEAAASRQAADAGAVDAEGRPLFEAATEQPGAAGTLPSGTKDRLAAMGHTPEQIDAMTPEQAALSLSTAKPLARPVPGARPVSDYAPSDLANEAQRVAEMQNASRANKGPRSIVDNKADAAENPEGYLNAERPSDARPTAPAEEGHGSGNAEGEQPGADGGRPGEGRSDGDGAQPRRIPAGIPEVDEVFEKQPKAATAERLTPEVERELRRIVDELQRDSYEGRTWHWLGAGEKKTGNAAGGEADIVGGHGGAAVYYDVLAHSPMNVVTSGRNKGQPARQARGDRGKVEAAVQQLLETGHATTNLMEGALRVAENRNAGIWRDLSRPSLPPSWGVEAPREFTDALSAAIDEAQQPTNLLDESSFENDAVETGEGGDSSFDITEFSQSLFDDIEPPDPKTDTLADTGEEQTRLPGDVGEVREQEVKTPEFEAPFSLTSEVAKPRAPGKRSEAPLSPEYLEAKDAADRASAAFREAQKLYRDKTIDDATYLEARRLNDEASAAFDVAFEKEQRRSGSTTLFQGQPAELTQESLDAWADEVKAKAGPELSRFQLALNRNGNIALEWIMVDRGAQRAGLGSKVMRELGRFADLNGRRIVLTPAEDAGGTRARLVQFYKRFGFVENKGSNRDFSIGAGVMWRDPTAIPGHEMGQPLFHGSPHDFERFSLQHVGTGEGAAAYGHGLYFAENPAVAANYHDQLSEGRDVVSMKLGRMTLRAPELDYTRNAHVNDVENIRASIAEDLLASPLDLNAAGESGFRDHVLGLIDQKIADYEKEYPEGVAAAKKLRAELEKPGALSVEFTKTTGGVYQVDIPDEHIAKMLDYDAPIGQQPPAVKEMVRAILKEEKYLNPKDNGPRVLATAFKSWVSDNGSMSSRATGAAIYEMIAQRERKRLTGDLQRQLEAVSDRGPNGEVLDREAPGKAAEYQAALDAIHSVGASDQKAASEALRAAGVPGLRYFDEGSRDAGKGTRNVVVFDDSIITLTHKDGKPFTPKERTEFFEGGIDNQDPKRGVIRFGPDRQFNIDLLERADLSTFLHESGHFFLEVFGDLADKVGALPLEQLTEEQKHLLSDYSTLLQGLGVERREDVQTPQHEQFARMFEAYLREGKAPSLALQTPFARFRAWLLSIYDSLKKLNVTLTPEVSGILDRMLASDSAIAEAEQQRGVSAMFTTPESAGMDPKEFQLYARTVADAHRDAQQRLDEKLLREVFREQTREWKTRRQEVKATVEHEVHQRPEYGAIEAMRKGTHPNGEPLVEGLITPPLQLSRKILEERFGAERIKRLPRGIVGSDGGLDPDVVAGMFGYSSADAMLTAVENAPAMKDVIERETKRRMIEEHGSILLDGSVHDKAKAAVANETHDDVIRAEMRALGRLRRTVDPFVKAERAKAADALEQEQAERAYERRWFEAEAKLRIATAEGHKQVEIDELTRQVRELRAKARGGAAVIRNAIPDADTLRDAAVARIGAMRIGDIKPATFWSASRRAGQQAIEKAARQDFDGAITAKQQELINLNLYRHAEQALEDVEDRVRFAKSLGTPAARKMFGLAGQSYLDQVDGILDRFDFAKVSQKVLDRRGSLQAFVASLEGQGLPVDIPDELLDESRRRNYKQLSVDELRGVTDGLKELQHLARLKNRLLRASEKRELEAVAGSVADTIRDNFTGTPATMAERDRRVSNERSRMIGDFFASHRKMASLAREMDGFKDGGPIWEQLVRPLNEAADREADMTAAATKKFGEIIEAAYPKSQKRLLYEKLEVPEVGQSLSRMERLSIALNWGNEGNRDRVRRGEGWTDSQVQAILDSLDARDLTFVQSTLDAINAYWPEIAAKQERVYGIAPEKVDATEIRAKAGTIAGGYFPLKYDDRADPKAGAHLDLEAGNLGKAAAYAQATTKRGHTKERVSNVKMPLRRDFGVIFEHVNQVIHDLTHHEALIDVNRVLSHKEVQKAIYQTHGDLVYRQFKNGVRDVAFGQVPAVNAFERAIGHVRTGATVAGLGWSLSTAMLHLTSALPRAVVRIGPEYVARGVARWTRDAVHMENTAKWIDEQSTMMRNRSRTQQREINELRNQVGVNTGKFSGWIADIVDKTSLGLVGKQGLVDSYFYLVQQAQRIADIPTWLGQYEKSMDAGVSEKDAIAHADQAVLDAFGGGQNKDLAAVQRGGPLLRLWTNFYSPFNVTYNLTVEATKRARFNDPGSIGRLAVDYLMLYSVPATMGMLIHGALKANPKQSTNDEDSTTIAAELLKAHAAYAADTMLGFRELSGAIEGYRGYEGPAGARLFASVGRVISQTEHTASKLHEGKPEEAFGRQFWLSLNDAGGVIFHYPSGQAGRTIDGIAALIEGKTSNPGALIVGAPKQQ